MSIVDRIKHSWNAFLKRDQQKGTSYYEHGPYSSIRPDRIRLTRGHERSIITAIFNRIALDVAAVDIKHCRLDENDRYKEDILSGLNFCLNVEANIDQTGKAFIQDLVMSMLDEGCVSAVPIDTDSDPETGSYDILTMRVGRITKWMPQYVSVNAYNELTGNKEDITVHKRSVAIIENPLYAVINEHNSTLQRLMRKLNLLDVTDERTASGKLDLIIQLPYAVKSDLQRDRAERRRKDIEDQLVGSAYGIAYIDSTEHVTQLNRAVENNLMAQVDKLTDQLFAQLGLTQEVLNGTADEQAMLNYYDRTIGPIVLAIVSEMNRKFLTKTARTQKQAIKAFRDPFKLVPINNIAEIADKFTRNEILTSNEIRQIIGMKPSNDPKADMLLNSNLNHTPEEMNQEENLVEETKAE